jgi:hypothetical protein
MIRASDIVVDCSPEGIGQEIAALYREAGVPAILREERKPTWRRSPFPRSPTSMLAPGAERPDATRWVQSALQPRLPSMEADPTDGSSAFRLQA